MVVTFLLDPAAWGEGSGKREATSGFGGKECYDPVTRAGDVRGSVLGTCCLWPGTALCTGEFSKMVHEMEWLCLGCAELHPTMTVCLLMQTARALRPLSYRWAGSKLGACRGSSYMVSSHAGGCKTHMRAYDCHLSGEKCSQAP